MHSHAKNRPPGSPRQPTEIQWTTASQIASTGAQSESREGERPREPPVCGRPPGTVRGAALDTQPHCVGRFQRTSTAPQTTVFGMRKHSGGSAGASPSRNWHSNSLRPAKIPGRIPTPLRLILCKDILHPRRRFRPIAFSHRQRIRLRSQKERQPCLTPSMTI